MAIDTMTVGYRYVRKASAALLADIAIRFPNAQDPAAKVPQIEYQLTVGNEKYSQRRYTEALAAYQEAEGLLYSLVVPRFDPATTRGGDVVLPVDRALFAAFAETALTAVRVTPDPGPVPTIGPQTAVTLPATVGQWVEAAPPAVVLSGVLAASGAATARADLATSAAARSGLLAALAGPTAVAGRATVADGVSHVDATAPAGGVVAGHVIAGPVVGGPAAGGPVVAGPAAGGASPAPAGPAPAERMLRIAAGVLSGGQPRVVEIPLSATDATATLTREFYQARTLADTPAALGYGTGAVFLPGHFAASVPHHYFFTVQLCLGDTYRQLGQYDEAMRRYTQARDYEYLNLTVEAPVVWVRMAECLVGWGYELFRGRQADAAAAKFAQLATVAADGTRAVPATSALYSGPAFAALTTAVTTYLSTMDNAAAPVVLSEDMMIPLRQAIMYQTMIASGLNALGLPVDLVPVLRYRYLEPVARYFTDQAIKAERDYITFMSSSEQETANQLQLRQQVDLATAGVALEARRVQEALAEQSVSVASQALAAERVSNADKRITEYGTVSADEVALDTATAHASGGMTETDGGYSVTLGTSGETVNLGDVDYEILRNAAYRRGMINRKFELDDMARTRDEYAKGKLVADAQVTLSAARVAVAQQSQAIAELRQSQAQQLLEFAQTKTFDAALWHGLAERMRELAGVYLQRAIEVAYIMQSAYNAENDTDLDVIAFNYGMSDQLDGLLGGHALMADIDYFQYHYVTQARSKEIPVRTVLSLAEYFPFALYQFRRTGVAEFETGVELFDRLYPGAYHHRIRAVEVSVEGVVPADGLSGALHNSGVSLFRTVDNDTRVRLQPRETQVISSYSPRSDSLVLRPAEEQLGVFEGSGVCTAWTLAIPADANDLRYDTVTDIKVVLSHTAFHDPALEQAVRAALPTTGQRSRAFSLRDSRPDAYFLLLESGTTTFDLGRGDFPYQHQNPTIARITLIAIADSGAPAGALTVDLAVGSAAGVRAVTAPNGTVASGGTALDGLVGVSPLAHWQLGLDPAANAAYYTETPAGSGIRRVTGLRDVVVALDYDYAVRATP